MSSSSNLFEYEILGFLLGLLQGLFEWLPISSEGQLVLVLSKFFGLDLETATSLALLSHIGTAFVVVLYYKIEFKLMLTSVINYFRKKFLNNSSIEVNENGLILTKLITITTLFTLPIALITLLIFEEIVISLNKSIGISIPDVISILIGVLLIITGLILKKRTTINTEDFSDSSKRFEDLPIINVIILGLIQGFAALPGISRSGTTITYLLAGTNLNQNESLRGSFLISVPVSIGSGILQIIRGKVILTPQGIMTPDGSVLLINYMGAFIMIITAFIVGYLSLTLFLDISKKFPFDKFMILFGVITIAAVILGFLL